MKKNNILIIGYGYMGKRIYNHLSHDDNVIYSLSRTKQTSREHSHFTIDLDQTNTPKLHLADNTSTQVIYLIPPPSSGKKNPRFNQFIKIIEQSNIKMSGLVLISTTAIYGNCEGKWIDEAQELNPQTDRAHRRVDAEKTAQYFCEQNKIPLCILRVAGIYAEDKLPLERIKQRKSILKIEESPFSNRIHAEDLTNICCIAITNKITGIFNCCDSSPSTMSDYFIRLAQVFNLPSPPEITMAEAKKELSAGMLSYMNESRRLSNAKLLNKFDVKLKYPSLEDFLAVLKN